MVMPELVAPLEGVDVAVGAAVTVPVQKEPRGQQAMFPALSRAQTEFSAQQFEPELAFERPEQELYFSGQLWRFMRPRGRDVSEGVVSLRSGVSSRNVEEKGEASRR